MIFSNDLLYKMINEITERKINGASTRLKYDYGKGSNNQLLTSWLEIPITMVKIEVGSHMEGHVG